MPVLKTIEEGGVLVMRLEMPRANAVGASMLSALSEALDEAEESDARALVLTGHGRIFSPGLDLLEASAHGREELSHFVAEFERVFRRLFTLPLPTVAAINGHAIAGGAILAFAADQRFMASGPFLLGLTEVELGLPFPSGSLEISRRAAPSHVHTDLFLRARRFTPEEARECGLVHEVVAAPSLLRESVARARELGRSPALALRRVKQQLLAPVLHRIDLDASESQKAFVDAWLSPPAQEALGAALARLRARRSDAS
jgi:enoyl-CoA hydratase